MNEFEMRNGESGENEEKGESERDDVLRDKLSRLRTGMENGDQWFKGPFGDRRVVFADWLASSRPYFPLESFIERKVLPYYANTHTFTSFTGVQSNHFREEARQVIQESVNANPKLDVVLFTGSGVTGAVNKLVSILKLRDTCRFATQQAEQGLDPSGSLRPVVFIGPYEHHSNMIPWREAGCKVVIVPEARDGSVSISSLETLLEEYHERKVVFGSFSAASNVTGLLTSELKMNCITRLLHKAGGHCFWDFASAAAYVDINVNPVDLTQPADVAQTTVYKDAVFLSPHKMIGGVNTPGILVVKKTLLDLEGAPSDVGLGGGTVFFVTKDDHRFFSNKVHREEGGTPDVIGAVRAGLAFKLKTNIGVANIIKLEERIWHRIRTALATEPLLELLGVNVNSPEPVSRISVLSFLIRYKHRPSMFLHFHFVSALLNDLFGIQSRGGCMCAGPYAQQLLGLSDENVRRIETELVEHHKESELLRPGFTRLSFMYHMSEEEVDFILQALKFIANVGFKFLPFYRVNPETGEWKHKSLISRSLDRIWLTDSNLGLEAEFRKDAVDSRSNDSTFKTSTFASVLKQAKEIAENEELLQHAIKECRGDQTAVFHQSTSSTFPSSSSNNLRWFIVPYEVFEDLSIMRADEVTSLEKSPRERDGIVDPRRYWEDRDKLVDEAKQQTTAPTLSSVVSHKTDLTMRSNKKPREKFSLRASDVINGVPPAKRKDHGSFENGVSNDSKSALCENGACFKPRDDNLKSSSATDAQVSVTNGTSFKQIVEGFKFDYSCDVFHYPSGKELVASKHSAVSKIKIPKRLLRDVGKAIKDWDLIQDGDRLLLGLSGGKDSLALLHILLHLQRVAPVKFTLACCTIDPLTESFNPKPLIGYLKSLDIEYFYVQSPIFKNAQNGGLNNNSICSFCARFKRGLLYKVCRENNFNKLVLAQHLDDYVESLMMSLFHNGNLTTMKSKYRESTFNSIEVIRPLCYAREHELKSFSYNQHLPVIVDNCPACFEQPKERRRMKKLLAREESYNTNIFNNLKRAIVPLMDENMLSVLKQYTEKKKAQQPKNKNKNKKQKI